MSTELIITVDDVIQAGHCVVPGLRDWCRDNGVDLRSFVKHGCPESEFLASGCALAQRVVELKKLRGQNGE